VTLFRYILAQSKNPGQAQKELWHNEALQILDVLVAGAVEDGPMNDPPLSPVIGTTYLVGDSPTGEWASHPGQVAAFGLAGWLFLAPSDGMQLFVRSTATVALYRFGTWEVGTLRAGRLLVDGLQVVGPRVAAVADPSGGTVVDAEARLAIGEILAGLRQHGLISS
jgi:hypothetical protein